MNCSFTMRTTVLLDILYMYNIVHLLHTVYFVLQEISINGSTRLAVNILGLISKSVLGSREHSPAMHKWLWLWSVDQCTAGSGARRQLAGLYFKMLHWEKEMFFFLKKCKKMIQILLGLKWHKPEDIKQTFPFLVGKVI